MRRRCNGGRGGVLVHLLFEYTGFACGLAANLRNERNKISSKDIIIENKTSYHNQLGHVQLAPCKGHASHGVGQS